MWKQKIHLKNNIFIIIHTYIVANPTLFCQVSNFERLENITSYFTIKWTFNLEAKAPTKKGEPKRLILYKMPTWASALQNSSFNGKYMDRITIS